MSFNKFSRKGAWRLFLGNHKYSKYHSYMRFMVYPIPFNKDLFPETEMDYPKVGQIINFNVHSALIDEFNDESILNHTMNYFLEPKNGLRIRFMRKISGNLKLPRNKAEVQKTLDLANRIENFIYAPQCVENMFDMAEEIAQFEFNLPPVSRQHYVKFLSDRLNEALFIRDHYAVKYIRKSLDRLEIDYEGYRDRLNKLQMRNEIIRAKFMKILNLEADETDLNEMLDEMVREGLRLYLCEEGVELMYYLKHLRDRWVERLLANGHNP